MGVCRDEQKDTKICAVMNYKPAESRQNKYQSSEEVCLIMIFVVTPAWSNCEDISATMVLTLTF